MVLFVQASWRASQLGPFGLYTSPNMRFVPFCTIIPLARQEQISFVHFRMPIVERSTNMPDNLLPYMTLRPMFEELRGKRVLLRPYTLADR